VINALLVAHIAVLGYWLGAELVINATFRFVSEGAGMPFPQRERLMDHVMAVDQHVRYALVLQATLGTLLALSYGFLPGGTPVMTVVAVTGALWLLFVEVVHRLRGHRLGAPLGSIDRLSRYLLLALLLAVAAGLIGGDWPLPAWLRWKLALFAGVVACGIGIRLKLIGWFRCWEQLRDAEAPAPLNRALVGHYRSATGVLLLLWALIGGIVVLSIVKPAGW
jgi:hypothetical protein